MQGTDGSIFVLFSVVNGAVKYCHYHEDQAREPPKVERIMKANLSPLLDLSQPFINFLQASFFPATKFIDGMIELLEIEHAIFISCWMHQGSKDHHCNKMTNSWNKRWHPIKTFSENIHQDLRSRGRFFRVFHGLLRPSSIHHRALLAQILADMSTTRVHKVPQPNVIADCFARIFKLKAV